MKKKKSQKNYWRPHLTNLTRRWVFYVVLLLIVGIGVTAFFVQNTLSDTLPSCVVLPGNNRPLTFNSVVGPKRSPVGSTVTFDVTGCNLRAENTFSLNNETAGSIMGRIVRIDTRGTYPKATVEFDLTALPIGIYDMEVVNPWNPPPPQVYDKSDSALLAGVTEIYNPDIVGWGWFGASAIPGGAATPGWLSLHCATSGAEPDADTCFNPDTGRGIDYGLGLYYQSANRSELRGYAWLGENDDENQNQADDTTVGWVKFDQSAPYPSPAAGGSCDGDAGTTGCQMNNNLCASGYFCRWSDCKCQSNLGVADKSYVDTTTGQVWGWARSATLADYGRNLQCPGYQRTWDAAAALTSASTADPRLATAPDGSLRAVWVDAGQIMYRQKVNGAWWGVGGVAINDSDIAQATSPDIVVDSNGTIHVAYINQSVSPATIHYQNCNFWANDCTDPDKWRSHWDAPAIWSAVESPRIATSYLHRSLMLIYRNDAGEVHAYIENTQIGSWTDTDGPTSDPNTSQPRVAVDSKGNYHSVWKQLNAGSGKTEIYYGKYDEEGNSWSAPLRISESGGFDAIDPDIAVDPDGQPHIVYDTSRWGNQEVAYVRYSGTLGWLAEERVSTGGNATNRLPTVTVGSDHTVHLVYRENTGVHKLLHGETPAGQTWTGTTIETIFTAAVINQITSPQVAVDRNQLVHAIYANGPWVTAVSSQARTCATTPADPNWGWISLRGGWADPALGGSGKGIGSCYDCVDTNKSCKICETDAAYYAPSSPPDLTDPHNPPIYACNLCTNCGRCKLNHAKSCSLDADCSASIPGDTCEMRMACRLDGVDCTDGTACLVYPDEPANDCRPVCEKCTACNQWGVSMETLPGNEGRFHGYAWSAGGEVPLQSPLQAGDYDSGPIETEYKIIFAPAADSCASLAECQARDWYAESSFTDQFCGNSAHYSNGLMSGGACEVSNTGPKQYVVDLSTRSDIPNFAAGYYYISYQGLYSSADTELATINIQTDGRNELLAAADPSSDLSELKACTFYRQVYLDKNSTLITFAANSASALPIDYFRITSQPIEPVDCATGSNYAAPTVYTHDVGFGWLDFSRASMIAPWTQTQYGDVYSRGNIGETGGTAPAGRYNATFILETGPDSSQITWSSQSSQISAEYLRPGAGADIFLPRPSSGYANFLGRIDYTGLTEGGGLYTSPGENQYSKRVINVPCASGTVNWSEIKGQILVDGILRNGIYHIGDKSAFCTLVVDDVITFNNGAEGEVGRGLFIVEGDLVVKSDINYQIDAVTSIQQLASVGWMIKGSVIVDPAVGNMVGAYIVLGCEEGGNCTGAPVGDHSGAFSTGDSTTTPLYVYGLAMAKKFNFERRVVSADFGSEVFVSNGRERANTPPGMASISQALPRSITAVHPE